MAVIGSILTIIIGVVIFGAGILRELAIGMASTSRPKGMPFWHTGVMMLVGFALIVAGSTLN